MMDGPIPKDWLYYGFWIPAVMAGLVEGGLIAYFLWRLVNR